MTPRDSRLALLLAPAVLAAAPWLVGCEGSKPEPKAPVQPQPISMLPPPPMPGQNPQTPQQQYGVVEAPPEGVTEKKMNAQAASAYAQGLMAFKGGDLSQAEAFFSKAVQADAEAYQAHYSLGTVRARLNKSSALSSFERAFEIVPEYHRAMVAYGMFQARRGNLSAADSFLSKKRAKFPKSAPITAALAEVKSLQKDTATAQDMAQEALKLDPTYAPAMITIARDHYRNRRLDLALYALKAVLDGFGVDNPARDKNNAEAHLLRAFIWAEQDNRPGAMEAFRIALSLRPDMVVASLRFSTYLLESGGAAEALPILQKALKYEPNNIAAHLSLGDAYRLTQDYKKAKEEFEWVKARDSSLAPVHYNLGLLYLFAPKVDGMSNKQQVEAAIASFNRFKELRPKSDRSDVDQLLSRANLKKAEIDAIEAANQPQPPPPPPPPPPATDGETPAGDAPAGDASAAGSDGQPAAQPDGG